METVLNKFEAYLLTEKCCSINTFSAYIQDIKQFAVFAKNTNKTLATADLALLKSFLKQLKRQGLEPRSIARKISSLKLFFKWAHQLYAWPNYAEDLILPKLEKKLPRYLTENEVQELLTVAHNDVSDTGKRNLIMLYLLYAAGVRITELTTLTTSNIQFDSGILTVFGKGNKERAIPLPESIMGMIKDYLQTVHKKFTEMHGKTDYLFPIVYAGTIRPISRQAFWAILKTLCKSTSIQHTISPHILRHSLATHLLKNGAHLRSLQLLLGHQNIATVEIYTHIELNYLRTIYNKKHPRS